MFGVCSFSRKMARFHLLPLLVVLIASVECLNILQFVPGYSHSHVMFNNRLAGALIDEGHNVTLFRIIDTKLNVDKQPVPKGAREHALSFDFGDAFRVGFSSLAFKQLKITTWMELGPIWISAWNRVCETVLDDIEINGSELFGRFDLALVHPMDMCASLISEALAVRKTEAYSPGAFLANEMYAYHAAVPMLASFIPQSITKFSDQMSIWQRMSNTLLILLQTYDVYIDNPRVSPRAQQGIIFGRPPYNDRENPHAIYRRAVENMIINGFITLDFPRPLPIGIHHLSDLTLGGSKASSTSPSKLEPQWEQILSSGKGAILFSFGTIAKTAEIPIDMRVCIEQCCQHFTVDYFRWRFLMLWPNSATTRSFGNTMSRFPKQPNISTFTWCPGCPRKISSVRK